MVKLVVALSLCVGLAESDEFANRFLELEAQVEAMNSLVESCCEATAQPTVTPPELNGCGEPCADVVTLDEAALDTEVNDVYEVDIEPDTCYVIDGDISGSIYSPTGPRRRGLVREDHGPARLQSEQN